MWLIDWLIDWLCQILHNSSYYLKLCFFSKNANMSTQSKFKVVSGRLGKKFFFFFLLYSYPPLSYRSLQTYVTVSCSRHLSELEMETFHLKCVKTLLKNWCESCQIFIVAVRLNEKINDRAYHINFAEKYSFTTCTHPGHVIFQKYLLLFL